MQRLQRAVLRPAHRLDPVPEAGLEPAGPDVFRASGTRSRLRLEGRATPGWIEVTLDLAVSQEGAVPLRLVTAHEALPLPPGLDGRFVAVLHLGDDRDLGLEVPAASELRLRQAVARELGRTEAALRRAAPVILRRLREPETLPAAALKGFRALASGVLLERLLQRGGSGGRHVFYPEWHARFAALSDADRLAIRNAVESLPARPRFSLLLDASAAPAEMVRGAVEAIRRQLYPDWELRIASLPGAKGRNTSHLLGQLARQDARLHLVEGSGPAAWNLALARASGEFVVCLEATDRLSEEALFVLATRVGAADVVYADEDHRDGNGLPAAPSFKPDWNPDLLLSRDYIGGPCAIRRSLLEAIGAFRQELGEAQVYDALLRASLRSKRFEHAPFVLCHRTATHAPRGDGAAERKSVQEHVGAAATVEPGPLPRTHRVRWRLPASPPLVSVIIATRDSKALLERAVESLHALTAYRNFELVVVDNQSRDPATLAYLAALETRGAARVARFDAPFNFSAINNFAVREHARGEVVALVNNDVEVLEAGWLDEMVAQALRQGIGAVGARLVYPDGTLQHGGIILGIAGAAGYEHRYLPRDAPGHLGRAQLVHDVSAVTAACLAIRRDTYLGVGGLDDSFPVALNDVDFCLRVRQLGLRNLWTPFATLLHRESATRGGEATPEKKARFTADRRRLQERWGDALYNDPAYNPNLSLESEDFSLAWPPRVSKPWRQRSR